MRREHLHGSRTSPICQVGEDSFGQATYRLWPRRIDGSVAMKNLQAAQVAAFLLSTVACGGSDFGSVCHYNSSYEFRTPTWGTCHKNWLDLGNTWRWSGRDNTLSNFSMLPADLVSRSRFPNHLRPCRRRDNSSRGDGKCSVIRTQSRCYARGNGDDAIIRGCRLLVRYFCLGGSCLWSPSE